MCNLSSKWYVFRSCHIAPCHIIAELFSDVFITARSRDDDPRVYKYLIVSRSEKVGKYNNTMFNLFSWTEFISENVRIWQYNTDLIIYLSGILIRITYLKFRSVSMLLRNSNKLIYFFVGEVMDLMALVGSAVNFVLYCSMSRQFRSTFTRLARKALPLPQQGGQPLTSVTT